MKSVLKNYIKVIKEKYIYLIILSLSIFMLFAFLSYNNLNKISKKYNLIVNENKIDIKKDIIEKEGEKYISLEDITSNFKSNSFYDNISRKLVITTWDNVLRINTTSEIFLREDDCMWYNIDKIANKLGYELVISNNNIYINNDEYIQANLKYGRTNIYSVDTLDILAILNKEASIQIVKKDIEQDKQLVRVKVEQEGKTYFGTVFKKCVNYTMTPLENGENTKNEKVVMSFVYNNLSKATDLTTVNTIAVDALRLAGPGLVVKELYGLKNNMTQDIYAVFSNGYNLANYDNEILTNMLNSDENKQSVIEGIRRFLIENNYAGVIIDFKNFKATDSKLLNQYIKELAANMHKENKRICVKVSETSKLDVIDFANVVDYIIVEAYGTRTLHSKTSGSHSTVNYVQNTLKQIIDSGVNVDKIILELPAYAILWTERGGTVINTEKYTMKAIKEYVKANNITAILDNASGQNYFSYTKGIVTYKMWLEDEISFKNKIDVAKSFGITNFSVYKSGDEINSIYGLLK